MSHPGLSVKMANLSCQVIDDWNDRVILNCMTRQEADKFVQELEGLMSDGRMYLQNNHVLHYNEIGTGLSRVYLLGIREVDSEFQLIVKYGDEHGSLESREKGVYPHYRKALGAMLLLSAEKEKEGYRNVESDDYDGSVKIRDFELEVELEEPGVFELAVSRMDYNKKKKAKVDVNWNGTGHTALFIEYRDKLARGEMPFHGFDELTQAWRKGDKLSVEALLNEYSKLSLKEGNELCEEAFGSFDGVDEDDVVPSFIKEPWEREKYLRLRGELDEGEYMNPELKKVRDFVLSGQNVRAIKELREVSTKFLGNTRSLSLRAAHYFVDNEFVVGANKVLTHREFVESIPVVGFKVRCKCNVGVVERFEIGGVYEARDFDDEMWTVKDKGGAETEYYQDRFEKVG